LALFCQLASSAIRTGARTEAVLARLSRHFLTRIRGGEE
jgi:hypothetical protein